MPIPERLKARLGRPKKEEVEEDVPMVHVSKQPESELPGQATPKREIRTTEEAVLNWVNTVKQAVIDNEDIRKLGRWIDRAEEERISLHALHDDAVFRNELLLRLDSIIEVFSK